MENEEPWRRKIVRRDVVFASLDELMKIYSTKQLKAFVWPDEGAFRDGEWHFNDEHRGQFEPLLIDPQTAKAMTLIHEALTQRNKATFAEYVGKGRGYFGQCFEFSWKHVRFGPA